nr:prepilin peptidase [Dyella sp. ASV24]
MVTVLPTLAVILSAAVALSDVYARRVPNAWLVAVILLAIVVTVAQWITGTTALVWPSAWGFVIGLAAMLPFYAIRWMGAGDVKLFATLGFLLGAHALLPIWAIGCLLTGLQSLAILLFRIPRLAYAPGMIMMRERLHAWPLWQQVQHARQGRTGQPHAAWLGIATILVVLHPELTHWGQP